MAVAPLRSTARDHSHRRNFKASLVLALNKLKDPQTPACSRVATYRFSKDEAKILVVRSEWGACRIE